MPLNHHSLINGTYLPPGDKSISHRILILAGQAIGKSRIFNLLDGEDVINTLKAMRLLGVKILYYKTYTQYIDFNGNDRYCIHLKIKKLDLPCNKISL